MVTCSPATLTPPWRQNGLEPHLGLLVTFLLGLALLAGVLLARLTDRHHELEQLSIAIALGTMVTLVVGDLVPEALEHLAETNLGAVVGIACAAAGMIILKVLDRFVPDHDSHGLDEHHHCSEGNVVHIGVTTAIAVSLHNLIEGMAVYSMTAESTAAGALVALGVGLHNLPMGMVLGTTLAHESRRKKTALLACATLSTFAGGLAMAALWGIVSDAVIGALIFLTLGMILYIVLFELLPHLAHSEDRRLTVIGVAIGVAIVVVSLLLGGE